MGSGTVAVLVGVGVIIVLLVMWGFIDIPFLHTQKPNQWRIDISAATEGGTVDNIQALAAVNPRGIIFVEPNEPLQVNASDFAGWAFSFWLFDDSEYGSNPYVVIPAQASNSTHTLVAVFEPKIPAFQITPILTTVKGASSFVTLRLQNNEDATITSVKLKLKDENNVFISMGAHVHKFAGNAPHDVLNEFGDVIGSDYLSNTLEAHSMVNIVFEYKSNPNISSGTYNLTWEIQFSVVNGSFSEPPELTIPWQVTILG